MLFICIRVEWLLSMSVERRWKRHEARVGERDIEREKEREREREREMDGKESAISKIYILGCNR